MHSIALGLSRQRLACYKHLLKTLRTSPVATAHSFPRLNASGCYELESGVGRTRRWKSRTPVLTRWSSLMPMASTAGQLAQLILDGQEDRYDGIILDADHLPSDPGEFSERLAHSLEEWRKGGRKGIWLKVPIGKAALIEPAVRQGFTFHHAEPDYVQLARWLPATPSKLPANASHQVGVGCFVLNERQEVLVVQEGNGPLRGQGVWKLVTGLVDAGEDIVQAAEREVLEETGVRATSAAVLALRQAHGFAFGKSDFFFVVALTPEPGQRELVMQEDELDAVAWMPLEEYAANPHHAARPLWRQMTQACVAYARGEYRGMAGIKLENGFNGRSDLLVMGELAPQQAAL